MLREFFVWWTGQLRDLLPARLTSLGSSREDALVIEPLATSSRGASGDASIGAALPRRGSETPLGHFDLTHDALTELPRSPGNRIVLRLSEHDVLAKTLILPIAAEHRLHQALAFQMDQETPFTPDEIYWSHVISRRDRQSGRLWVRLLLVPRQSLAALLAALDRAGIVPSRAEIGNGPDSGRILPLDAVGGSLDEAPRRTLHRWAAAACLLLAATAIAIPFVRQAIALASVESELAAGRATANEVDQLRRELGRLSGTMDLIESERQKAGRPLAILAALTRMIPDDTYLTELTAQQRKVTLSGRSAAAARLIGALSGGDGLRNVAFAAPVTRLEAIHAELFTITAEIAP